MPRLICARDAGDPVGTERSTGTGCGAAGSPTSGPGLAVEPAGAAALGAPLSVFPLPAGSVGGAGQFALPAQVFRTVSEGLPDASQAMATRSEDALLAVCDSWSAPSAFTSWTSTYWPFGTVAGSSSRD